ncbi:Hypothetical protein CAP_1723 [Chondromyces apiculatus DSM 436]|uniref:Uncharacterized protein n=1 Tax=Chondromyces apiculatus DSM 436 TaxID=1192034 RepID=A0A017TBE4_9BACT|nr:Hypothetical protein CAP_1723 [Chondromyces apiculatus DSM 436]
MASSSVTVRRVQELPSRARGHVVPPGGHPRRACLFTRSWPSSRWSSGHPIPGRCM